MHPQGRKIPKAFSVELTKSDYIIGEKNLNEINIFHLKKYRIENF